ncbi:peritrophin-1-like [Schistocerca cancellata]|uniref:peritrophin-1-like n=1 Tax=Schistocerca cancellata TaxID=274614 RepID=UPI0021184BD8|nr:peritrophin-1-like [Schistocerca cancellata]
MRYTALVAAFVVLAVTCVAGRSTPRDVPECPPPQPGVTLNITFYPNDEDCNKYWECDNGNLYNGTCPEGLVWNPNVDSCDFPFNYNCTSGKEAATGSHQAEDAVSAESAGVTCPAPSADGSHSVTFIPHEDDCGKYWRCDNGLLFAEECPEGQVWVDKMKTCDWELMYPCEKIPKSESWWSWVAVKRRTILIPEPVKKLAERKRSQAPAS